MDPVAPPPRSVSTWLYAVYALVFVMVVVGGITRLTGSGLSIVEWKPVSGALPPLSEADWVAEFARYQASPQFRQVNHWMTLADFKPIFFWEYLHRLLGRVIGVVFFLPWLWFTLRGRLRGRWAWRTAGAFVLGGLQGALGWFMVASGLVDVPQVSHVRLAAHLGLAFFVGHYVLWLCLDLAAARRGEVRARAPGRRAAWAFVALTGLQIVWGAFMAGSRAGYLFDTFPDMNGAYWFGFRDFINDPVGIHFFHRALGWLVAGCGLALAWRLRRVPAVRWVGVAVLGQSALGVLTVVHAIHPAVAVVHQAGAWVLLTAAVVLVHRLGKARP